MISLIEQSRMVHKNAVSHGFWEGTRDADVLFDLIHAEWTEALEEDRAGRPQVCALGGDEDDSSKMITDMAQFGSLKPEGVCVELMDGAIRILDLMAAYGLSANAAVNTLATQPDSLGHLIAQLHDYTTRAWKCIDRKTGGISNVNFFSHYLCRCLSLVWWWIERAGYDPIEILNLKHIYNQNRPYRHGKRY